MLGRKHSEETKAKMREAHAFISDDTKAKLRQARQHQQPPMLGRHHTEATKAKISKAHLRADNTIIAFSARKRARKLYACPDGKERHHIDGNPWNNSPENIAFVTRKEHMLLDGRLDKLNRKSEKEK